MKLNVFILMLAAILLVGCGRDSEAPDGARTVHVNLADTLHVAFDENNLIRLETNDSSLLYDIGGVASIDGKLVVYSRDFMRVYDKSTGKYLHDISRVGQGPTEYLFIVGFWNDGDTIRIMDIRNQCISSYMPDDTFVGRKEITAGENGKRTFRANYVVDAPDGNGYYIINSYTGGTTATNLKYSFFDADMQFVEEIPGRELTEGSFTPDRMITDFNKGRVLSWDQMRDTLYTVDREGEHPLYIFDFGKNRVPQDISSLKWFGERANKFAENKSETPYASFIKYYQPYKDVIFFSFATSDEKVYLAEYDEVADKITTFSIHDPEGRYKQSFFFKVDGDTLLVSMDDDDPDTNPMLYRLPINSIPR